MSTFIKMYKRAHKRYAERYNREDENRPEVSVIEMVMVKIRESKKNTIPAEELKNVRKLDMVDIRRSLFVSITRRR